MTLLNGGCLITLSYFSDIVLCGKGLQMCSGQSSEYNDGSYELMSLDDLQMLGVHATGQSPNQGHDDK